MNKNDSLDKLSKIATMFVLWIVFVIISVFIVKKLDNSDSSSFLFSIAEMSNGLAEGLVNTVNEELKRNDILFSEQTLSNSIFGAQVYWMSSTLIGYYVATCLLGIGILPFALKLVFCPLISPLVMPIVFLIATISFIKNVVMLIKRLRNDKKDDVQQNQKTM